MRIALFAAFLAAGCFTKPQDLTGRDGGQGPVDRYGAITVGARHACAISADGELFCWGDNKRGQVGLVDPNSGLVPTRIGAEGGGWTAASAGGQHTCGLRDGGVLCWGFNEQGQVGGGRGGVERTPIAPTFTTPPPVLTEISAGGSHSCAIGGGELWCWGQREPLGQPADISSGIRIGTRTDWITVAAGTNHVCGIAGTEVLCFGKNDSGQAGQLGRQPVTAPTPVELPDGLTPLRLTAGFDVSCVIMGAEGAVQGELWCWGENDTGLIASNAPTTPFPDAETPTRVGTDDRWSQIAVGSRLACGIRDGVAACWGSAADGAMGNGYWNQFMTLVSDADPIGAADAIALGLPSEVNVTDAGGCLSREGGISCWGSNAHGRLGDGYRSVQPLPVEIAAPAGAGWEHVFVGRQHTCGQVTGGELYCWGANDFGQVTAGIARGQDQPCVLGQICDVPLPRPAPAPIARPSEVVAGYDFTCARQLDKISCWGQHFRGETGKIDGGFEMNLVTGAYTKLLGGARAACGTTGPTGLTCWGPVPTQATQVPPMPVAIVSSTSFASVSISLSVDSAFACGRNTDGFRVCWGSNMNAQLGKGDMLATSATFTSSTAVLDVATSEDQGCEIVAIDANVSCWGRNQAGEVGVPTGVAYAVDPRSVLVPGMNTLTGCTDLSLASYVSCAVCTGRPYCWGFSQSFQLGRLTDTDAGHLAVPVAVPSGLEFVEVAAGEGHSCARTDTNRLFCWGGGQRGQLGDGGHDVNLPTALGARQ